MSIWTASKYGTDGLPSLDVPVVSGSPPNLPAQLTLQPGAYNFHGAKWDLSAGGLYILNYVNTGTNPISGDQQYAIIPGDLAELIRAVCVLTQAGDLDNGKDFNAQASTAVNRPLGVACGDTCLFFQRVLNYISGTLGLPSYPSRFIRFATVDPNNPLNAVDSTHVAMELYTGDHEWTFVDPTFNWWYGKGVTADQFAAAKLAGTPLVPIQMCPMASQPINATSYPRDGYLQTVLGTPAKAQAWVDRVECAVGIDVNGGPNAQFADTYCQGQGTFVSSLNPGHWPVVPYSSWKQLFYPTA